MLLACGASEPSYMVHCYSQNIGFHTSSTTRIIDERQLKSASFEGNKIVAKDWYGRNRIIRIADNVTCTIKEY